MPAKKKTAAKKAAKKSSSKSVASYKYKAKRANNPEVGLVSGDSDRVEEAASWSYDPHLAPELRFDSARAGIEKLIDDALASDDPEELKRALAEIKRLQQPYLNWTGKAEKTSFEVDTVSLHVHEKIDPVTILDAAKAKGGRPSYEQPDLFEQAFEAESLREAIEFYKHQRGWANRLVAGDSLQVMNSLLQKESMAGQVQMIYIDPPYGIKYGSNFQPFVNKRDVKDRKDEDLTQEPEMIKAFRDTWELGIHSYLTYLRDRLLLARELLHESGSVFVQISDENVHLVRNLMDEVMGQENFVSLISYSTTTGTADALLSNEHDKILWYGRNKKEIKYNQLWLEKGVTDVKSYKYKIRDDRITYNSLNKDERSGASIGEGWSISQFSFAVSQDPGQPDERIYSFRNREYDCGVSRHWKTKNPTGLDRLAYSGRLLGLASQLNYIRLLDDYPLSPLTNVWNDTGSAGYSSQDPKRYVVQTDVSIVERCLLMTTDSGDLVLDPTCGSGTTASVAEKWGRRWITCDTSRVAVALAKQRLMTASFDYFTLNYPEEGVRGGFVYKTVPHITLKAIANNPEIDEIYERMHPAIESALSELNQAAKLQLNEWEVPFDFPEDWPEAAETPFDDFHKKRIAMQQQMDASIANHADQEILYDQPKVDKSRVRVAGPFTVEATPFPTVLGLEEAKQPTDATAAMARSGESARQHEWKDELLKAGIRGKGGQKFEFAEIQTLAGTTYLHASGITKEGEQVAISFGPEHAALEQRQVEFALNEAQKLMPKPKFVVFAAFHFDPEAAKDIDELNWPGVTLLKAQMNTDLLTEDLKKERASNESFWLMGQPEVKLEKLDDGRFQIEVLGFDYFDTKKGDLVSGGKGKIAAWMLDPDYDERALYPRQVFFPMAGAKDGWAKLAKDLKGSLNEELLEAYRGTTSIPFEVGDNRRCAVKIIDDRGIESLRILALD
ncbi:MAG: site-specific DNA-methyltransferase [Coraliomargarita sp.]